MPPRIRPAFSLLEVVIALGLLAIGASAVLSLYLNNLRTARQAKDQITLTLLTQDLRAKTQLAAYTAFSAAQSTFNQSGWLLRDNAAPDDPGTPARLDGGGGGGSSDEQALNGQSWELARAAYDRLAGTGTWESQALYGNWQFRMRTVLPPDAENNQFVDWDGYDVWDSASRQLLPNIMSDEIDGAGTEATRNPRTPVKPPATAQGTLPPNAANAGFFGPPRPSHGVAYDPRGLRFYLKRLKCVIGWDLRDRNDIFSGQHYTCYFTVYSPDARKRP